MLHHDRPLDSRNHPPFNLQTLTPEPPIDIEAARFHAFRDAHPSPADAWADAPRADWMLAMLDVERRKGRALDRLEIPSRRFAVTLFQDAGGDDYECAGSAVRAVLDYINKRASIDAIARVRERARSGARSAGLSGIPRRIPGAAHHLAAFHLLNEDWLGSAVWTQYYCTLAVIWRVFPGQANAQDDLQGAQRRRVLARQAEILRFNMHNPFEAGVAAGDTEVLQ